MERVTRWKSIVALSRERNAVDMAQDCFSIGTSLIKNQFHGVRQQ
jgi:hypothetical protein